MSTQAYLTFSIPFIGDGVSSNIDFNIEDVPVILGGNPTQGLNIDLGKVTSVVVTNVISNSSNITANITSSTFSNHTLSVSFNAALAAATGRIDGELVF